MTGTDRSAVFSRRVALVEVPGAAYDDDVIRVAVQRLGRTAGWAEAGRGPLGAVVPPGARVVVKPNLVLHANEGPWGLTPLVTHAALIRATVESALEAGAGQVLVGDAPLQSCDFHALIAATGLQVWTDELAARDPRFSGLRDFRRTRCTVVGGVRFAAEDLRPREQFTLFDLAGESLLEPVTRGYDSFRVGWYDPRLMAQTHGPGRHQYLVAREILEADVIINLPKLKTHKKAGLTGALKNLIGINGNKEYLPHHRLGGDAVGGDAYPGRSAVKEARESAADRQNEASSPLVAGFWHALGWTLTRLSRLGGDRYGIEGSWSGNDTIWRTCLDLNRILLYGRADGTLVEAPARCVLHLVDAVVAGQGDGPLAPRPFPLGLLVGAQNPAALDWVAAELLGYQPERIPLVREAFARFRWPLAAFPPQEIERVGEVEVAALPRPLHYPHGWQDVVAAPKEAGEHKLEAWRAQAR